MLEGGPILAASFVESDLVDEAVLLHGVKSVGVGGIDPLEGMPLDTLTGRLTSLGSEKLDVDTIETFVRV
jgi:riboflavin biosynthesis pyrimidine reductase